MNVINSNSPAFGMSFNQSKSVTKLVEKLETASLNTYNNLAGRLSSVSDAKKVDVFFSHDMQNRFVIDVLSKNDSKILKKITGTKFPATRKQIEGLFKALTQDCCDIATIQQIKSKFETIA